MNKEGLKKTSEFRKVFTFGKRRYGRYVIIYILKEKKEANRAGFIVKKCIGKAVKRNKVKRRLREIWRQKGENLITGSDITVGGN